MGRRERNCAVDRVAGFRFGVWGFTRGLPFARSRSSGVKVHSGYFGASGKHFSRSGLRRPVPHDAKGHATHGNRAAGVAVCCKWIQDKKEALCLEEKNASDCLPALSNKGLPSCLESI